LDDKLLIAKIEEFIRRGNILAAQNEIKQLKPSAISREWIVDFANMARRLRMEDWGVRLLRPIVRGDPPVTPQVTQQELCAYAGLLIKIGALPEAEKILQALEKSAISNVPLFQSQICIAQWDYKGAVGYLQKTLLEPELDPYQKCIAEVNLAGAYIFLQKNKQAEEKLQQVLKSCQENNWDLLYGNALELSAQLAVLQNKKPEADRLLAEAQARAGQHSHYSIFIEKWKLLSELHQAQPGGQRFEVLQKEFELLRQKAETLKSWESVRDLDYQLALVLNHENLLLNVYFGTPHAAYRKRIEKIFSEKGWKIPNMFFRKMSAEPAERVLNVQDGKELGRQNSQGLKPGQMLHRLLNILATDFYKPFGIGELFSKLYPEEYFNPDSSPDRVSQAVKHLRKWFVDNEIPMDIKVEGGRYGLMATGPYALQVSKKVKSAEEIADLNVEKTLQKLKTVWPYKSFSAQSAALELEVSVSSIRPILQKGLAEKKLFKSGVGRSTLYRFQK
jgi:DNA-binding winged helix-turn-helix (wHTH) protein